MSNFLSKEQEQQMVEEYLNGTPIDSLLNKYGFKTRKSITDKVKKYYGKEKRTELINQTHVMRKRYNYTMETISCNFDAYLLGLLLTDGYILTHDNGVGLDLTDEDVIKFVADTIGTRYKKYEVARKGEICQNLYCFQQ